MGGVHIESGDTNTYGAVVDSGGALKTTATTTPATVGAGTAAAAGRVTLASDDPAVATLGAISGAAVITDANGTLQQYLRGLVKRWVDALGAGTAAAALRVVLPTDQTAIPVNAAAAATGGYSYSQIAAGQATSVVKASAGTLHSITFNSAAVATNITTVYDHASGSGTVIAIIDAPIIDQPVTLLYDIAFATGCTIITTVANGANMTVAYK